MIQICHLWNLSLFSVLVLTLSNILLTVKLLHNGDCPTIASTITNSHNTNNNNNNKNTNNNDNINQNKIIHSTQINNVNNNNNNNNNFQETIDNIILNDNDDSVNGYAIPKPPLTPSTCVEYIIPDEQSNITDHAIFSSLNVKLGRWDSRRLYQYYDYAVIGDEFIDLSKRYTVCLATQTSLERLHSLVQVAHHWRGPISIAVFVTGNDELYLLQIYITYLRKCYAVIRDEVSIHLAYPKLHSSFKVTESTFENLNLSNFNCNTPELTLSYLLKLRSTESVQWHTKYEYPQNHLRNLARKGCQNDYVFLTDVDIIPSLHFAEHLDKFLRKTKCQNLCAYVIPTYEIDNRVQFPKDKLDLIRLARKGLARPFHHKVFIYNQFATNFSRWETDLRENGETHISYNVTNFEFLYEPFYVATDLVPLHDERFLGYGFTRNTQVYEMFVAGYQFQVLSPIFTCHWGLQNKKNRPVWRERQNNQNRKQLEIFKREVFARYRKDPLKMLQPKIKNGKYVHIT